MPLQERLWADKGGKAPQSIPSELPRFGGQPAPLVVGELWLFAKLFPEHLHFLLEVFDDELLVAVEPTGQADKQELQSVHRPILPTGSRSFEAPLAALATPAPYASREFSDSTGRVYCISGISQWCRQVSVPSPCALNGLSRRWTQVPKMVRDGIWQRKDSE